MKKSTMKLTLEALADMVAGCEQKGVALEIAISPLCKRVECNCGCTDKEDDH